jgi:hypothetical protein
MASAKQLAIEVSISIDQPNLLVACLSLALDFIEEEF